jgi:hypothetical protein
MTKDEAISTICDIIHQRDTTRAIYPAQAEAMAKDLLEELEQPRDPQTVERLIGAITRHDTTYMIPCGQATATAIAVLSKLGNEPIEERRFGM